DAGDARSGADAGVRLRRQLHAHQDVPGEDLVLDLLALAVLDLDLFARRHLDLVDEVLHVEAGDTGLEVGLDLVLVAGVRVHHVPVAGGVPQGGAQFGDRVLDVVAHGHGGRPRRHDRGVVARLGYGGVDLVVLRHAAHFPLVTSSRCRRPRTWPW